ncbi:TonB-dependent receptor [Roseateles sp. LYH14W]|uniref:TonB-dependent receptor n=1 Tax=Pelomonas parva TaxID=3299032 RepID=A0ABW7FAI2_9BURK
MKHPQISKTRRQSTRMQRHPVALASTLALLASAGAVQAQQAAPAAGTQSLETVVVTGIRRSLDSAVTLKRESRGLVDGIVAEDIGKFPDTNLAESMQRIAGVSIDRNASGEGSRVTVRGVGPDFNMVLLNGRQMPTSIINQLNNGASGSRAFDFANLSSDSISALEVYKTARAESPTGGIGATINVKTARPLDMRERIASIGVKANYDGSVSRLPNEIKGDKVTPEISGIYSDTFGNRTLGIAISGSYSKRSSGSNNAYTQNGWLSEAYNATGGAFAGVPASNLKNFPTSGFYTHTNDMRYSVTALDRERLNGQVVLQFAPTKELKFTVDHTMAVNTVKSKNLENSAWFGPSFSGPLNGAPQTTFTSGPVATPIIQTATWDGTHDYSLNAGQFAQKTKLNSTGFNAAWKVNDALSFDLDVHSSKSKTTPDSPYGTYATMSLALFTQGNTTAYYDKDLPIMESKGMVYDPAKTNVTGSQFYNNLSDQTVDQGQLRGTYRLSADDKLIVGLGFTKLKNRAASANNFHGDWSGIGPAGGFKNLAVGQYSLGGLFNRIPGHDDPRLYPTFFAQDFEAQRKQAVANAMQFGSSSTGNVPMSKAVAEAYFAAPSDFSQPGASDWRTTEKSTSAYGQWDHSFDTAIPMNLSVGLRYESTKIESSSQVTAYTGTDWYAQNEVRLTGGTSTFGTKSGKYSYWLPSIDWDADLADNLKVRASFGVNIGRPGFDQMLGGTALNADSARYNVPGAGSAGDPALKPLKSKNLDLSAEYYYAKSSYVALGAFYKKVSDFITATVVQQTFPGLNQPASGTYHQAALASGIPADRPDLIRQYIFNNYAGQPGVTVTNATLNQGNILGSVPGTQPLQFNITSFANAAGDNIKGLEFNFQHMFGNSGFGVSGNYTMVKSGLKFINNTDSNAQQSPLVGISDSANLVGFYENDVWSIRAAYNWRDEFLARRTDGGGNNPMYTEAYGQVDASIGYKIGKNLTLQADLLNLNDGYIRQHGRTKDQVNSVLQTGRRYLIGARYRF